MGVQRQKCTAVLQEHLFQRKLGGERLLNLPVDNRSSFFLILQVGRAL